MEAGGGEANSRCVPALGSQQWLDAVLGTVIRGAGDAAAKCALQRDPVALLCPVSLHVGMKAMPRCRASLL